VGFGGDTDFQLVFGRIDTRSEHEAKLREEIKGHYTAQGHFIADRRDRGRGGSVTMMDRAIRLLPPVPTTHYLLSAFRITPA